MQSPLAMWKTSEFILCGPNPLCCVIFAFTVSVNLMYPLHLSSKKARIHENEDGEEENVDEHQAQEEQESQCGLCKKYRCDMSSMNDAGTPWASQ